MNSIALTVYFDGQFYVGVLEKTEDMQLRAARMVFGAEPREGDVLRWVQSGYPGARLSAGAVEADANPCSLASSPKRRQRQAARIVERGASTRAQQALALERELHASQRRIKRRERLDAQEQLRFAMKQAKRKQKHRGH